ncbi:MAG TPA: thioredoxin family protein [Phnomibacter sp.]|nr:thioredoxin family protein [Phnomibacter sp.]
MHKVSAIFGIVLLMVLAAAPHTGKSEKGRKPVGWQKPADAALLLEKESRPILVDVYTTWCQYCKVMDNTTWRHDSVVQYLAQNFYTIKLNAEDKQPQSWMGKNYEYNPRYKVNMLAVELLRGNMVYPSTVIIPPSGEWQVLPGALKPAEIELALKYYGSQAYKSLDFETFRQSFSSQWRQ